MDDTVTKKVHFFEIIGLKHNDGEEEDIQSVQPLFNHVKSLPGPAYSHRSNGDDILMKLQDTPDHPQHVYGVIGLCRRHNLPYKENAGHEAPLQLESGESLFEPAHFVLFPGNTLGMEYNHTGPKTTGLKSYLLDQCSHLADQLMIAPLLNQQTYQKLRELDSIKLFDLSVKSDGIERTRSLSTSLHDSFRAASALARTDTVEIVLRAKSRKGRLEGFGVIDRMSRWIRHASNREVVDKFLIKGFNGETGRLDVVDLMEERILSVKHVLEEDPTYRHVNSHSMWTAIEEAYRENRQLILASRT